MRDERSNRPRNAAEVEADPTTAPPGVVSRPGLIERVREHIRYRHFSFRSEQAYVG